MELSHGALFTHPPWSEKALFLLSDWRLSWDRNSRGSTAQELSPLHADSGIWGLHDGCPRDSRLSTSLFRRRCCSAFVRDLTVCYEFSAVHLLRGQLTRQTKWIKRSWWDKSPCPPRLYTSIWMVVIWSFQKKQKTCMFLLLVNSHRPKKQKDFVHLLPHSTTNPAMNYFSSKTKQKSSTDFSKKPSPAEVCDYFIFLI